MSTKKFLVQLDAYDFILIIAFTCSKRNKKKIRIDISREFL